MATTAIPALFVWKNEYCVGHPEIDGQHRQLVDILNKLHEAMLSGRSGEQQARTLDNLVHYTKRHFAAEEKVMKDIGYPAMFAHMKLHQDLTAKVLDFQRKLAAGMSCITIELLQFLKDWLYTHISQSDKEVGKHYLMKAKR